MTPNRTANETVVEAYVDVWNERDYSQIPDLVSDSFVLYDPTVPEDVGTGPVGEARGPTGLVAFMNRLERGFPDFQFAVADLVATDDLVMDEVTFTGTHEGVFNGVPPTYRSVEIQMMAKFHVEEGKLQEHHVYFDQREFMDQLGLTFPTVIAQLPTLVRGKVSLL
jgi:steroid delta-isomerase-like uncharacterized protein